MAHGPRGGDERGEILRKAGPYLGLGTIFAASIVLGIVGGWWLDGKLGTEPWFILIGTLLGLAAGFYNFFVVVTRRPPE
ncbi:MAG TPA: AtpZ/AtpI family protein [Candidatus Polarisedimenticolia bacterium]|nr:AtpZ/AtpI family protein [Candidatus Polarisedimenticolia bacterium]